MSVKALEQTYKVVTEQYLEMKENLKEMEEELQNGLIAPEFVENLQSQIAPIKQNYEWWSYVMFLLHEPNRKDKIKKYRRRISANIRKLDPKNSPEARVLESKAALESMKELV